MLCALAAQGQNLISNGNFETGPFAPSSTITNWTVSGTGHIHSIEEGATTPTHSAALNIGHDSQGTILSQSFPTVVGKIYSLDFDAGIFGQPTNTLQVNVQVNGSNNLINQTITPPVANTFDAASVAFQHHHYVFVADSTTTTLQFTDIGFGNLNADTLIDSVSVAANLLLNPHFEIGPEATLGTVTNWVVGGPGNVAQLAEGSTSPTHSATFSAGNDPAGDTLSQTVATTNGQTYAVTFDAGVYGQSGATQQLNVKVIGASNAMLL